MLLLLSPSRVILSKTASPTTKWEPWKLLPQDVRTENVWLTCEKHYSTPFQFFLDLLNRNSLVLSSRPCTKAVENSTRKELQFFQEKFSFPAPTSKWYLTMPKSIFV